MALPNSANFEMAPLRIYALEMSPYSFQIDQSSVIVDKAIERDDGDGVRGRYFAEVAPAAASCLVGGHHKKSDPLQPFISSKSKFCGRWI